MSQFRSLDVVLPTKLNSSITTEDPFFKKFNHKEVLKHSGRISHISYGPNAPHDIAVCSHTRVHIYDATTMKIRKNLTRFSTTVLGASIRDDNQMAAAASDNGVVQLFDINSRSILRTFNDHQTAAYLVQFVGGGVKLLTGSDDRTAKIYDIATEKLLHNITCHTDSIRCGFESTLSKDVIVTGSFDHSICFTDLRVPSYGETLTTTGDENMVMRLNHGAPVTSLVMFPESGVVASGGDQYIRCYDLLQSNNESHIVKDLKYHQKGITSLSIDAKNKRLLSCGVDGFVKMYDCKQFLLIHSIPYDEPLISVAFSPDANVLAVGALSGNVHIAKKGGKTNDTRGSKDDQIFNNSGANRDDVQVRQTARQKHFLGGVQYRAVQGVDVQVGQTPHALARQRLQQHDVRLKQFQHGPALDAAVETNSPATICAMIDELQSRGALRVALENRDDTALEPVLKFAVTYATNPLYSNHVVTLINAILDVYTPAVGQSSLIDEILLKIDQVLHSEMEFQRDCFQLLGEVDMFMHNAQGNNMNQPQSDKKKKY